MPNGDRGTVAPTCEDEAAAIGRGGGGGVVPCGSRSAAAADSGSAAGVWWTTCDRDPLLHGINDPPAFAWSSTDTEVGPPGGGDTPGSESSENSGESLSTLFSSGDDLDFLDATTNLWPSSDDNLASSTPPVVHFPISQPH
eukprot:COSAG01_NODE_13820_length_1530_cov_2.515024_1_plen_140_part_10